MKALLINPTKKMITPVAIFPDCGSYQAAICKKLSCKSYSAYTLHNSDVLYWDDEALNNPTAHAFQLEGYETAFFGKCLVVGVDQDTFEEISCHVSFEEINRSIRFFSRSSTEALRKEKLHEEDNPRPMDDMPDSVTRILFSESGKAE